MARKVKSEPHRYFHESSIGEHWARITVEWSDHPDTPQNWKDNAAELAEAAFAAAQEAASPRQIVQAIRGKTVTG